LLLCVFRTILNKKDSTGIVWPCPMIVVSLF
jgi:hypothetical protein